MSHKCGYPLGEGRRCRQPVADDARPDCGRHPERAPRQVRATDTRGCRMVQVDAGAWRCKVHGREAWQVAESLGACPPCQIPGTDEQRLAWAGERPLDVGTATILARDPAPLVRSALAKNPDLPDQLFIQLAQDIWPAVLRAVAENPNCSAAALEWLAHSSSSSVRMLVAGNPRSPSSLLQRLMKDQDGMVSAQARSALLDRGQLRPTVVIRMNS